MTIMNELSPDASIELKPTLRRVIVIWWAYVWRYVVAVGISLLLALVLGMMLGIVMQSQGYSATAMRIAGYLLGGILGLAATVVPLRLIIGKEFRGFRLVLVKKPSAGPEK